MYLLILIFTLFAAIPTWAVELYGAWQQGGYIYGQAEAGAQVTINGKKAITAEDGRFLYGLDRHFKAEAVVQIKNAEKTFERTLIIEPRSYKTQHIKGVSSNKVNTNTKELERIRAEKAAITKARKTLSTANFPIKMAYPVSAPLSGVYGSRRTFNGQERSWHKGADLAAPSGTPVVSPASGKVIFADETFFSGNIVIVDHGFGLFGHFAHLKDITVRVGEEVDTKTILGHVGSTGRSTGPHLHWGLYFQNVAVDPLLWLQ